MVVLVMRVLAHPCVPRLFDVMHSVRFVHLVTEDGGADLFELLAQLTALDVLGDVQGALVRRALDRALPALLDLGQDLEPAAAGDRRR